MKQLGRLKLWLLLNLGLGCIAHAITYEDWVAAHGLPSDARGPADAPAGDGIANLLKFGMGLDPMTAGPSPLFEPVIVERDGQQHFGLRLTHATGAQSVRLDLWGTDDLRAWRPRAVWLEKLGDLGPGLESVQLLDAEPLAAQRQLFVRLSANLNPRYGQLVTGPVVPVASDVVGSEGETLTVETIGSPLRGLLLEVPALAYPSNRTFTIRYAPILTHNFAAPVTPVTPLIQIDNGGALAEEIMTVRVPLSIPPDTFAMGFLFHADTGELEGMPLLELSTNSITLATRHFSTFFISSIPTNALPTAIDSGFKPGVDDWEFENRGSFLAQGGHCSGQCASALWYYCNRKLKDTPPVPLYGRYDNSLYSFRTPAVLTDNVLGYKLASRVQEDTDWDSLFRAFALRRILSDLQTLLAFTYSMLVTGEPQHVAVWNTDGGHALAAYRVNNNVIQVADPNYPGKTDREITYDAATNGFAPYSSGATAADLGHSFPIILYYAKTCLNDWAKIGQRWKEFDAGTIASSDFPVFKVQVKVQEGHGDPWEEIAAFRSDIPNEAVIETNIYEILTETTVLSGPSVAQADGVNYGTSYQPLGGCSTEHCIALQDGTNRVGVELRAKRTAESAFEWAGFSWLAVARGTEFGLFGLGPCLGKVGDTISVYGIGFGNTKPDGAGVFFSGPGLATEYPVWTDSLIRVKVPPGAWSAGVHVQIPIGESFKATMSKPFTVVEKLPYPRITALSGTYKWGFYYEHTVRWTGGKPPFTVTWLAGDTVLDEQVTLEYRRTVQFTGTQLWDGYRPDEGYYVEVIVRDANGERPRVNGSVTSFLVIWDPDTVLTCITVPGGFPYPEPVCP